jgi:hypothetical protein
VRATPRSAPALTVILLVSVALASATIPASTSADRPFVPSAIPAADFAPVRPPEGRPNRGAAPTSGSPGVGPLRRPRARVATVRVAPTPRPTPRARPAATPRLSRAISGVATWYCLPGVSPCMAAHPSGGMFAAAGPALRAAIGPAWRGTIVRVDSGAASLRVQLVDWCLCTGGHLIDLYSDAMRQIDPGFRLRGGAQVTVRW